MPENVAVAEEAEADIIHVASEQGDPTEGNSSSESDAEGLGAKRRRTRFSKVAKNLDMETAREVTGAIQEYFSEIKTCRATHVESKLDQQARRIKSLKWRANCKCVEG